MLRTRLWDIGLVISRTLTYTVVTVLLVGVYAGLVLLATRVLAFTTPVAVAGSTLAAAAVFNPVRQRVQRAVDRRFNRARYDADQAVAAFAARLQDAADPDAVHAHLLAVVPGPGAWRTRRSGSGSGKPVRAGQLSRRVSGAGRRHNAALRTPRTRKSACGRPHSRQAPPVPGRPTARPTGLAAASPLGCQTSEILFVAGGWLRFFEDQVGCPPRKGHSGCRGIARRLFRED